MTCSIHDETEECLACLIDKIFATCEIIHFPKDKTKNLIYHTPTDDVKDKIIASIRKEMS